MGARSFLLWRRRTTRASASASCRSSESSVWLFSMFAASYWTATSYWSSLEYVIYMTKVDMWLRTLISLRLTMSPIAPSSTKIAHQVRGVSLDRLESTQLVGGVYKRCGGVACENTESVT